MVQVLTERTPPRDVTKCKKKAESKVSSVSFLGAKKRANNKPLFTKAHGLKHQLVLT